jgi:hypothetical protein
MATLFTKGDIMKYHAISRGPGQPTCPRCHQPELAYRAEDGAGDRYQC